MTCTSGAPTSPTDQPRETILPLEGESEADYRASLSADCQKIRQAIQNGTGEENVHVIAYPSGRYNSLAQVTLLENGFDISFTTEEGTIPSSRGSPSLCWACTATT